MNAAFPTGKRGNRDVAVVSGDTKLAENGTAQVRVLRQQAGGDHVMGLAAAHGLLQSEDPLRTGAA